MQRNLELKARIASLKSAEQICQRIKARRVEILRQRDTYFRIRGGRLKLREFPEIGAELIFYRRPNIKGGRYSTFIRMPVKNPDALREALRRTMGTVCVVRKKRLLYTFENSRIHLDVVPGLGTFIEFEVLIQHGTAQAKKLLQILSKTFQIQEKDLIAGSYADLLARKGN
jgi:predicted adenylyl cyclase CyaB